MHLGVSTLRNVAFKVTILGRAAQKAALGCAAIFSGSVVSFFLSLQALVVFGIALGYVFTRSCKLNEPSIM